MAAYFLQISGEAITLGPEMRTGGEAKVHTVLERPELVAKLYTKENPEIEDKLSAMIATPPPCNKGGGTRRTTPATEAYATNALNY